MCGNLKTSQNNIKFGNLVQVTNVEDGRTGKAKFTGFAKTESLKEFWSQATDFASVNVNAESFSEKGVNFTIRGTLKAIGLQRDVAVRGRIIGRKGEVKIVTRAPLNDFEKKVHKRWPLVETKSGIQQWTEHDAKQLEMELPTTDNK